MNKLCFVLCFLCVSLGAQSLFDTPDRPAALYPSGNISTAVYAGEIDDSLAFRSLFSRADITLKTNPAARSRAVVRLRLSHIYRDTAAFYPELTEAYAQTQILDFHLTLGKQLLSQARADVFPLFDDLTPVDYTLLTPDQDDRRQGQFALTLDYDFSENLKGQFSVIPVTLSHTLPVEIFDLPENVIYRPPDADLPYLTRSSWTGRLSRRGRKADYSLILQNMTGCQPLFTYEYDPVLQTVILSTSQFRHTRVGFDAAFALGRWNTRLEAAYTTPEENTALALPEKNWQWTLGMDRQMGAASLLMEYHGILVPDYEPIPAPGDPFAVLDSGITQLNRLYFKQEARLTHEIFLRPALSLFHETLDLECPVLFNFENRSYYIGVLSRFHAGDGFKLTLGYDYYHGPAGSLFEYMSAHFNSFYLHLEQSF